MKLSTRTLLASIAMALTVAPIVSAQDRPANGLFAAQDVPVRIGGDDGGACLTGRIEQRVSRGDERGFGILVVHTGPGEDYAPVDTVRSGEVVYGCQVSSDSEMSVQWIGVIYGPNLEACGVDPQPGRARNYSGTCRNGWINAEGFSAFQSGNMMLVGSADDNND